MDIIGLSSTTVI